MCQFSSLVSVYLVKKKKVKEGSAQITNDGTAKDWITQFTHTI